MFQAINRLESELSPNPLNLQVLFVGATDGRLEQSISEYGIENHVKVQPPVPHRSAIEIVTKSYLLLLVKATGEGSYGQIPATFYEYLGTGNPIICIGSKESEVANLISESKAGYVEEDDFENLVKILNKLLRTSTQDPRYSLNKSFLTKFDNTTMARRLFNVIY